MAEKYDLVIIGAGLSGLGAALYAGRFRLNTLVIGKDTGGVINTASKVDNYPGLPEIDGMELGDKVKDHAMKFGANLKLEIVKEVCKKDDIFEITTNKDIYLATTVIIATGSTPRKLGIPGEEEFWGNGVHTCAMCDGYIYNDKTVAVVGGSDSAAKEALILAETAKKVYIIYRREKIRAEPITTEAVKAKDNIEIIYNTNVTEAKGEEVLNSLVLDKEYNNSNELKVNGMFVEIGHVPLTDMVQKIDLEMTDRKEIIVNTMAETNVPGVFGAGDVTSFPFKQAITGVAQGVTAAWSAFNYIKKKKN